MQMPASFLNLTLTARITNEDANWEEKFWKTLDVRTKEQRAFITAKTLKTEFHATVFMQSQIRINGQMLISIRPK